MFVDFQEALVIVAGDGIWTIAIATLAGAVLLALLDTCLGAVRKYLS